MAATSPAASAGKPGASAAPNSKVRYWGVLGAFAALVVACALPTPQGLPVAGQFMLGMLLFSVILWMTEAVDYAISAVLITALMAFLLGLAPNAPIRRRSWAPALRSRWRSAGSPTPRSPSSAPHCSSPRR